MTSSRRSSVCSRAMGPTGHDGRRPSGSGSRRCLSASEQARRRLAEAAALDRLLDLAPEPRTNRSALADRIVAAAAGEAARPQVIRLPQRGAMGSSSALPRRGPARSAGRASERGQWAGGALLAASLVLGAFMGTSGVFRAGDPASDRCRRRRDGHGRGCKSGRLRSGRRWAL